jgi:hypothetical protein
MNIGEEEEAIEVPIPLAPGKQPIREPSPQVVPAEPVKEPAHSGIYWDDIWGLVGPDADIYGDE